MFLRTSRSKCPNTTKSAGDLENSSFHLVPPQLPRKAGCTERKDQVTSSCQEIPNSL